MFILEIGKDRLGKQFTINMCFFQLQSAIAKFHLLTVFLAGVNIENELWLADVRFGGTNVTILQIKGLEDNQVHQNRTGRIRRIGDQFIFEQMVKTIVRRTRHHKLSLTDSALKHARKQSSPVSIAPNECPHAIEDFHEFLLFHQINLRSIFTHDRLYTMPKSWGESNSFRKHSGTVTSTFLEDNAVKKIRRLLHGEEEIVKELESTFGSKKES